MRAKFFANLLGFLILATTPHNPAFAQPDYCTLNESGKKIELHMFGESYQSSDDQQYFMTGMTRLYSIFEMGDAVRIIVHRGRSTRIAMDECMPGCPDTGLFEGLFSNSCSEQISKKDMISFKNKYVSSIKKAASSAGEEFDIIEHLTNLQDYFSQRDVENFETYVFHSLVPFGVEADDEDALDSAFVNITQTHQLSELELPQIQFVNTNPGRHIQKFWKDLGLKGHSSGLNIRFDKTVID